MTSCRAVVVGIGSEFRSDDAVGLEVARRLDLLMLTGVRVAISDGEPLQLIDAWDGVSLAVVVDAVTGGASPPGTLHQLRLPDGEQAWLAAGKEAHLASWHGSGLRTAVELGLALGRLPGLLIVHGVEASDVSLGRGLSPEVAGAADRLADLILAEVLEQPAGSAPQPPGMPPPRH